MIGQGPFPWEINICDNNLGGIKPRNNWYGPLVIVQSLTKLFLLTCDTLTVSNSYLCTTG
jgi:hypothetical protein